MHAPTLTDLVVALGSVDPFLVRARAGAGANNAEGGDPASHADPTLLARHLGNYLAAAEVARGVLDTGPGDDDRLLDVGCGTGAYSAWLADRLGLPLHLADHDADVLAAASAAFDVAGTARDLADAPLARVVTAMEVLEHIEPTAQPGFLAAVVDRVAPGGVLVVSTPDESLYPGGWSGYAPHVGCVTADGLAALLTDAAGGRRVEVLRLVGGPFDVPVHRRWVESVGNRAWTALQGAAPTLSARLARGGGTHDQDAPVVDVGRVRDLHRARVLPADAGQGGSLLGIVTDA